MQLLTLKQTSESVGLCPLLCINHRPDVLSLTGPQSRSSVCSFCKEVQGQPPCFAALVCIAQSPHPRPRLASFRCASRPKIQVGAGAAMSLGSSLHIFFTPSRQHNDMWGCDAWASCFSVGVLSPNRFSLCFRTCYSLAWLCSGHFIRWSVIEIQGMKIWWSL